MKNKSGIIRIKREGTFVFYNGDGDFSISNDSPKHNISLWFTRDELEELSTAINTALAESKDRE